MSFEPSNLRFSWSHPDGVEPKTFGTPAAAFQMDFSPHAMPIRSERPMKPLPSHIPGKMEGQFIHRFMIHVFQPRHGGIYKESAKESDQITTAVHKNRGTGPSTMLTSSEATKRVLERSAEILANFTVEVRAPRKIKSSASGRLAQLGVVSVPGCGTEKEVSLAPAGKSKTRQNTVTPYRKVFKSEVG
ncbi:hypothetical protein M405DRAFT_880707 [Rhizopogon salebrosus TDB-379]|nr:hypothetical protein M405DRAFT_880707 [Rhizopogon salebrosus TDB-379]